MCSVVFMSTQSTLLLRTVPENFGYALRGASQVLISSHFVCSICVVGTTSSFGTSVSHVSCASDLETLLSPLCSREHCKYHELPCSPSTHIFLLACIPLASLLLRLLLCVACCDEQPPCGGRVCVTSPHFDTQLVLQFSQGAILLCAFAVSLPYFIA